MLNVILHSVDGAPYHIRAKSVDAVWPSMEDGALTTVLTQTGLAIEVRESMDEVLEMIEEGDYGYPAGHA